MQARLRTHLARQPALARGGLLARVRGGIGQHLERAVHGGDLARQRPRQDARLLSQQHLLARLDTPSIEPQHTRERRAHEQPHQRQPAQFARERTQTAVRNVRHDGLGVR